MTAALSDSIQGYDEKIERLGPREVWAYDITAAGERGGPIRALAYVLTLENPERFAKSRDVGPYLGLVPKQEDSGESQPQLGSAKPGTRWCAGCWWGARSISWTVRTGHGFTTVWAAALRARRKECEEASGGSVARKLAVLLHRLWATGRCV